MIYLKGFKAKLLNSVMDLMYHGAADIYQDDLAEFLEKAEELELKGLTGGTEGNQENYVMRIPKQEGEPLNKEIIKENKYLPAVQDDFKPGDISNIKESYRNEITTVMKTSNPEIKMSYTGGSIAELKATLWSLIAKNWSILTCSVCGKTIDKTLDK